MGEIYRQASRAVVWLGPASDDSLIALKALEYLGSRLKLNFRDGNVGWAGEWKKPKGLMSSTPFPGTRPHGTPLGACFLGPSSSEFGSYRKFRLQIKLRHRFSAVLIQYSGAICEPLSSSLHIYIRRRTLSMKNFHLGKI